ncbi:hypothetical protein GCM10023175_46910 [Pseudonocardia xishanensis]|uniref:Aldehyde dehydrogenase domain-containing protein n=1 Tax=Pseudonocardia xishanensis TaxID=630995 RepID=A0ABP8RXT4_9PSEU
MGPATGEAIVRHPAVRRIAFIGSVQTGQRIQEAAAQTGIKDVSLELGGKNALIAFPDADPVEVAGAAAVTGGAPAEGTALVVPPTVFTGVSADMRIAQEEVFGPLLSVIEFDTEEEAVAIANGVEYGLTAAVWTDDVRRAHRVAAAVDADYVWINGSSRHYVGTPFGGLKSSGLGREECVEELLSFTGSAGSAASSPPAITTPDARSSRRVLDEFSDALPRLADTGGPIVGIRGEGKGFCAGYDVDQVGKPKAADPVADRERLARKREPLPGDLGPPQAGDRRGARLLHRGCHADVRVRRPHDRRRGREDRRARPATGRRLHRAAVGPARRTETGEGAGVPARQRDRRPHRGRVGLGQPRRAPPRTSSGPSRRWRPAWRGSRPTSCASRSCRSTARWTPWVCAPPPPRCPRWMRCCTCPPRRVRREAQAGVDRPVSP